MRLVVDPAGRRRTLRGPSLALASIATLAGLLVAGAGAEAASPTETLRAVYTEANQLISTPATDDQARERLAAIRALFGSAFDFRGAAERALGRQWRARTTTEQNAFATLFAGFVQRGFLFWLASVAGVDGNGSGATITYLRETVDRDRATVWTAIEGRGGRELFLDHNMIYQNKRWVVRDVTIDGVSLVASYRSQFERVIRTSSYRELVERMQQRVSGALPGSASARPGTPEAIGYGPSEGR